MFGRSLECANRELRGRHFLRYNFVFRRRGIQCFILVKSNVMDEDYYDEMNDESVDESDEEIRPPYNGTIQPYMFEPTMAPDEAAPMRKLL